VLVSARIATLLMLPIAVTFLLRGDRFIGLWMGESYAGPSGELLRIFSISLIFMAAGQVLYATLMGLNQHRGLIRFNIVEALANLALSIVLVRAIGLPGIAWGTTLPSLVMSLLVLPWYARRTIGLGWGHYYWNAWIRPFSAGVPFVLGTAAVAHWWPGTNLFEFFCGVAAALPLAAIGYWIAALEPAERRAAGEAVAGLVRRLKRR
jgi:O-antigen/teichoic acid export membrane protein